MLSACHLKQMTSGASKLAKLELKYWSFSLMC